MDPSFFLVRGVNCGIFKSTVASLEESEATVGEMGFSMASLTDSADAGDFEAAKAAACLDTFCLEINWACNLATKLVWFSSMAEYFSKSELWFSARPSGRRRRSVLTRATGDETKISPLPRAIPRSTAAAAAAAAARRRPRSRYRRDRHLRAVRGSLLDQ